MQTMKRHTKIIAAVAAATIIVTGGLAWGGRNDAAGPAGGFAGKLAELGITEDQKAHAKSVLKEHQPTFEPLFRSFASERRALGDLMHAETVDEAAIRAQVQKLAKIGADLAVERAHVAHDIRILLTPEQIRKLAEMHENVNARLDQFIDRIAK